MPSFGHHGGSAPYPTIPNHPHPNPSIGSSHFPSNGGHAPFQPQHSYPSQSSYPGMHSSYPGAHPSYPGAHTSYPGAHPSYHPQHDTYRPPSSASAPFVPGKTVIIMPESSGSRGGGLGSSIATGVAGGVAAGATNAIVGHALNSIFRPSHDHVHTYPSAPAPGTPTTVTHTTNNYYGGAPVGDAGQPAAGNNNNNNGGSVAPGVQTPSGDGGAANPGVAGNPGTGGNAGGNTAGEDSYWGYNQQGYNSR